MAREPGQGRLRARRGAPGFDLIETMRFDPDEGVPLLELHLERIKASAAELGFAFDRHDARNRIQALCFELDAPARLRLLLARSGEIALEAAPLPRRWPSRVAVHRAAAAGRCRATGGCATRPPTAASTTRRCAAAQAQGAAEALFVRDDGLVTEGSFTNVFVERDGVLLTPPAALGLLPGRAAPLAARRRPRARKPS